MAFHKKFEHLLELRPDIAIIPECANPDVLTQKAPTFVPSARAWIGDNPNKGLGIFTFGSYRGALAPIYRADFPYIAPVTISGPVFINLVAVWACHNKPHSFAARLGPLRRAIAAYGPFIRERPTLVAGDLNDNALWDRPAKINNHSANVTELEALGLRSAYHTARGVQQGDETEKTLYWRDRSEGGPRYHIDYCFIPAEWTKLIDSVVVGGYDDWVGAKLSDHVPLIVEVSP
jgi:exodeoxyribonuclease-3